jgi:hypothetical protein
MGGAAAEDGRQAGRQERVSYVYSKLVLKLATGKQ